MNWWRILSMNVYQRTPQWFNDDDLNLEYIRRYLVCVTFKHYIIHIHPFVSHFPTDLQACVCSSDVPRFLLYFVSASSRSAELINATVSKRCMLYHFHQKTCSCADQFLDGANIIRKPSDAFCSTFAQFHSFRFPWIQKFVPIFQDHPLIDLRGKNPLGQASIRLVNGHVWFWHDSTSAPNPLECHECCWFCEVQVQETSLKDLYGLAML